MNRTNGIVKAARKADPRMPFEMDVQNMLTGYLYPQLHRDMRRLPVSRKQKAQP